MKPQSLVQKINQTVNKMEVWEISFQKTKTFGEHAKVLKCKTEYLIN